jgi:DNA (cytosine-5)-methyltransferase 1
VFVVGYLGDWRVAAAVLLERESLQRNTPPRREAGKGFARGVEIGPSGGSFCEVNPTLDSRAKDGPIRNQLAGCVAEVSPTVQQGPPFSRTGNDRVECEAIVASWPATVAPTLNAAFADKQGLEDQHINGGGALFVPAGSMGFAGTRQQGRGQRHKGRSFDRGGKMTTICLMDQGGGRDAS